MSQPKLRDNPIPAETKVFGFKDLGEAGAGVIITHRYTGKTLEVEWACISELIQGLKLVYYSGYIKKD